MANSENNTLFSRIQCDPHEREQFESVLRLFRLSLEEYADLSLAKQGQLTAPFRPELLDRCLLQSDGTTSIAGTAIFDAATITLAGCEQTHCPQSAIGLHCIFCCHGKEPKTAKAECDLMIVWRNLEPRWRRPVDHSAGNLVLIQGGRA